PGASGEVARHGPQGVAAAGRRLSHPDAPQAPGLVDPRARGDQRGQPSVGDQVCEHLPGGGVDVHGDPSVGLLTVEDLRDHGEVPQPWVRRGAHHHLADVLVLDLRHRDDVSGGGGPGDQRFQLGEVDVLGGVVGGALVCDQAGEVLATTTASRYACVASSAGKTLVVAPSSAPMFAMTCRSIALRSASPGPWYSMIRFTPPLTSWRRSISRTTSLAETQAGSLPVSSTPQISGIVTYSGCPAIAIAISRPPTPIASM